MAAPPGCSRAGPPVGESLPPEAVPGQGYPGTAFPFAPIGHSDHSSQWPSKSIYRALLPGYASCLFSSERRGTGPARAISVPLTEWSGRLSRNSHPNSCPSLQGVTRGFKGAHTSILPLHPNISPKSEYQAVETGTPLGAPSGAPNGIGVSAPVVPGYLQRRLGVSVGWGRRNTFCVRM
jgi:hypothetical protein